MQEQKKYNLADGNIRKHFVTYKQAAELYSMGMNRIQEHAKAAGATYKWEMSVSKFMQLAKDAKACYKVNQLVLVNLEIIDKYLETFHIVEDCLTLLPSNSLCFHE